MNMQTYDTLYQNWCDEEPCEWEQLLELAADPQTYASKDSIPLFSFYSIKDDAEATWAGPKAVGVSMENLECIIVDYDDGIVLMKHLPHMYDFDFLAYSSPTCSDEKEKFRMIIRLEQPIPNKYLRAKPVREYLMDLFPHCDNSTFDFFRRQRIPSKLSSTKYGVLVSNKPKLALDISKIENIYQQWKIESEEKRKQFEGKVSTKGKSVFQKTIAEVEADGYADNLRAKYKTELSNLDFYSRGNGVVHSSLRRIIYALRKTGMPEDDVLGFVGDNVTCGITPEIEDLTYSTIYD